MSDEEKRGQADFVIVNDGETPLIPQVLALITFLSQNNTYLCPPKNKLLITKTEYTMLKTICPFPVNRDCISSFPRERIC